MSQYELLCQLLPLGRAFSGENQDFHRCLQLVAQRLDEEKNQIHSLLKENPREFKASMKAWLRLFHIPDSKHRELLNQEIAARLTAEGGQSKAYLHDQLSRYSKKPIEIVAKPELLQVVVSGVCTPEVARAGAKAGRKIMTFKRNEQLINRFKTIRHAEIEARYY